MVISTNWAILPFSSIRNDWDTRRIERTTRISHWNSILMLGLSSFTFHFFQHSYLQVQQIIIHSVNNDDDRRIGCYWSFALPKLTYSVFGVGVSAAAVVKLLLRPFVAFTPYATGCFCCYCSSSSYVTIWRNKVWIQSQKRIGGRRADHT